MKVLRFFCNLLYCIVLCFGISVVQVGMYDIVASQSSSVEGIHLSENEDTDTTYFDSYAFWATDIKTNYKQDAKYRVRNWFSWKWWKNGMGWADSVVDTVIATVKPIVVPVAQVNAVKEHYGRDLNYFSNVIRESYSSDEEFNNALYEMNVYFGEYSQMYDSENIKIYNEDGLISEYTYTGDFVITEETDLEYEYKKWIRNNKQLYNINWKLNKYNCGEYDKYFTKFISESDSGERYINTAVIVLYYQQYVSIIIAIFFVCKYPISLLQSRLEGSIFNKKRGK